jgi:hypothetical protein
MIRNLDPINTDRLIDLLRFSIPHERNEKYSIESKIFAKHLTFCVFICSRFAAHSFKHDSYYVSPPDINLNTI